ncbi:GAF domain-containing sensor histidine kinase [Pedobacter heparinus]|uniref:GAF domain-containing sensor histidine kinase n=1 Tax=Pedobacter heparinus TaxID=984 RepID=UPI00292F213B|nr:GAF domain-containing sensor histidine kinase [Pedobacter heparinus]
METVNILDDLKSISRIAAVDSILEIICRTTGMGFAAVARVTETQWIVCAVKDEISFGLKPGGELILETTICNEIRSHHQEVVIDHVAADAAFADHHTPKMYGFQSYISIPILLKDGTFFGTLCAIDPLPRKLRNEQIIGMFKNFAELIAAQLEIQEKVNETESSLAEERKTAELREQFIAILGHDLRNPVGAVSNAAQLLLRMPLDDRMRRLAGIIQDSSLRIKGLIENILDFARGRLGEGIRVNLKQERSLGTMLFNVITELQLSYPDRVVETDFRLSSAVSCDGLRIAQLFSNLLGNALSHGDPEQPVKISAITDHDTFILCVSNFGEEISAAAMGRLFQPFSRGEVRPGHDGLGLGLFISSEIAKAHGGTLDVVSENYQTCFTLKIPLFQD